MKKNEDLSKKFYHYGFDYLRVLLAIIIIAWHSGVLTIDYPKPLAYILQQYVGLLAVPLFFQLSLYLYVSKNTGYFQKRMKKLLYIYIFWLPINFVLPSAGNNTYALLKTPIDILYTIMGNHSVMYFIVNLMLCTSLCEFVIKRKLNSLRHILIGFSIAIVLMFFGSVIFDKIGFPLGYANPLNFFPYVFSSLYIVDLEKKNKVGNLRLFFWILIGLIFAFAELSHAFTRFSAANYGKISLIFASMCIITLFQRIKAVPPKFISYISGLTLGLYVIHDIVIIYVGNILKSCMLPANNLLIFVITVTVSITFVSIIKYKNSYII